MRLLFAIKSLVVQGGGAERVFVDVINGLVDHGADIDVVTFDEADQTFFYQLDDRVKRYSLSAGKPGQPTPRTNLTKIMAGLRKLAAHRQYDVAVGFMHSTYIPLTFALLGKSVPVILSEHIDHAHYKSRPVQRWLSNLVLKFAYAKTVPTKAILNAYPEGHRKKILTMANPVTFYPKPNDAIPVSQSNVVLAVGRFMGQKDFSTLIIAFASLSAKYPNWKLRIIGDGVLRAKLEKLVRDLGISSRVQLPGVKENIGDEYYRSAFLVVPSLYESFGLVTAEALACGRPVISFSDCVGSAQLIKDGVNGLLVEPGDDRAGALAQAIKRLITDSGERARIGSNSPETVSAYSAENVITEWENLLMAAAKRAPLPAARITR